MLLRNRLHDSKALITFGSSCLAIALVAQRFVHPDSDFGQGFIAGLSGLLIGVSIVFNLWGLVRWRREREGRK